MLAPDPAWEERKEALDLLQAAAEKRGEGQAGKALETIVELSAHADRAVRHAALTLLGQVSDEDMRQAALSAALARVKDRDSRVRTMALDILGQASHGDPQVISAASAALEDWHRPARSAALQTLRKVAANTGSKEAAAAVLWLLEDPQNEWRQVAAKAICEIAHGDLDTIELAARRLESSREEVRAAAQDAVSALWTSSGDCFEAVLRRLESEVDYIRVAAGQAFARVITPDDLVAARALTKRLQHEDAAVRNLACVALSHFSPNVVKKVLLATMHSPSAEARCSALSALASAAAGDLTCIRATCRALQDPSPAVRAVAIPVTRTLITGQDPKCCVVAAKVAAEALEHPNPDIQHAGSMALVGIARVQNPAKKAAPKQTLEQQLAQVRASPLAQLQARKGGTRNLDDEEETFPKVSGEELEVVIAMLDAAEAKQDRRGSDDQADKEASEVVLGMLNGMTERTRALTLPQAPAEAAGLQVVRRDSCLSFLLCSLLAFFSFIYFPSSVYCFPSSFFLDSFVSFRLGAHQELSEESEWENDDSESATDSDSEEAFVERPSPTKRLQEAVKTPGPKGRVPPHRVAMLPLYPLLFVCCWLRDL